MGRAGAPPIAHRGRDDRAHRWRQRGTLPRLRFTGTVDHRAVAHQIERRATHAAQSQRSFKERRQHRISASTRLHIGRETGQRLKPAPQVVNYQQSNARHDSQNEQNVEIVSPWYPCTTRTQKRIVEMVHRPEREGAGERPMRRVNRCAARAAQN